MIGDYSSTLLEVGTNMFVRPSTPRAVISLSEKPINLEEIGTYEGKKNAEIVRAKPIVTLRYSAYGKKDEIIYKYVIHWDGFLGKSYKMFKNYKDFTERSKTEIDVKFLEKYCKITQEHFSHVKKYKEMLLQLVIDFVEYEKNTGNKIYSEEDLMKINTVRMHYLDKKYADRNGLRSNRK